MIRAVLLNDTSSRYHHGCLRVSRVIKQGLLDQGIELLASSFAHTKWDKNKFFLQSMQEAQLIIINGEGTMHNGAESGHHLLSVVEHQFAHGKPIALINSIWENNPSEWLSLLDRFTLVSVRDSNSLKNLQNSGFNRAFVVPDLSLTERFEVSASKPCGLIVGDSVKAKMRHSLGIYCQRVKGTFLPTKFLSGRVWQYSYPRRILWRLYTRIFFGQVPNFKMALNEEEYLNLLSQASGHVTGRFHGVCFSILAEVPFFAISSVTSKINTLLVDAGLNKGRLVESFNLQETKIEGPPKFSPSELENIRKYKKLARKKADQLFKKLAKLIS